MNNGDCPAMPLTGDAYKNFAAHDDTRNDTSYDPECQGLTKFEHFVGLAMAAITTSLIKEAIANDSADDIASMSIELAEAVLRKIEDVQLMGE